MGVLGEEGAGGSVAGSRQAGRSQLGVPAEDDLQLGAVQLPSVGQSHDALLVALQTRRAHVLPQTHQRTVTVWSISRASQPNCPSYIWQGGKKPELTNR